MTHSLTTLLFLALVLPGTVLASDIIFDPPLVGVTYGDTDAFDFDGDGDDDVVVVGRSRLGIGSAFESTVPFEFRIHRNDDGRFVDVTPAYNFAEPGLPFGFGQRPRVKWADIEGDGDADLVLAGVYKEPWTGGSTDPTAAWTVRVVRNDEGVFVDASQGLPDVSLGDFGSFLVTEMATHRLEVGDIDADGDLDIFVRGTFDGSHPDGLFINGGASFTRWTGPLPGVDGFLRQIQDVDLDGDADVVAWDAEAGLTLFRNDGGSFVATGIAVPEGTLSWGDYDGDGDADIHVVSAGTIWRNDDTTFTRQVSEAQPLATYNLGGWVGADGESNWGDVNDDGLLDLLVVGRGRDDEPVSAVYRNTGSGFVPSDVELESALGSTGTWGDVDGDGRDDLILISDQGPRCRFSVGGELEVLPLLEPLYEPVASWADVDGDGDHDLIATGLLLDLSPSTTFYRAEGRALTPAANPIPDLQADDIAWLDIDNDNDADVVILGRDAAGRSVSLLFRNDAGAFVDSGIPLPTVGVEGEIATFDFDNDGLIDLVLAGRDDTRLLRNVGGQFEETAIPLPGVTNPGLSWADFDGDLDVDLAIGGGNGVGAELTGPYRNDGDAFVRVPGIDGISSPVSWLDYDADGDMELVGGGSGVYAVAADSVAVVTGSVTPASSGLSGVDGRVWADVDRDGDLDAIHAGGGMRNGAESVFSYTGIYLNSGGELEFTDWISLSNFGVGAVVENPAFAFSGFPSLNLVDVDGDGDRDLHLAGLATLGPRQWIWTAHSAVTNRSPGTPSGLRVTTDGDFVTFEWQAASDDVTPSAALTYSLVVGSSPGSTDLLSPMADLSTGRRFTSGAGNVGATLRWRLRLGVPGPYFWGVQAVDQDDVGGAFEFASGNPVSIGDDSPGPGPDRMLRTGIVATYPNPFNPRVTIEYTVDRPQQIEVSIFDLSGRKVRVLESGLQDRDEHRVVWNGVDSGGRPVAAGTYFVRMQGESREETRKVVLVK